MSSRRVGQPNVTFGPSTIFLDFPRSDGDETKLPTSTIRIVDHEGQVNFMELLDAKEHPQARKWRSSVGRAVATKLGMQGDPNNYVLRDWPANYRLYDHHKGPAENPRHDLYLYGCARSGRFRSINEFIPHAIWLFSDPTLNYANCECKYCTRQPQKGITASMGEILGTSVSASPTPRVRREKAKAKVGRPYASVQKILQPSMKPSALVQDYPTLAERNSDLRATYSHNSMKLKRWYREGEVVWCELRPPIPGPSGDDSSSIVFWPGLVQEYKLKSVPVQRETFPASADSGQKPSNSTPGPSTGSQVFEEGHGTVYDKAERPPFTVEQSTVYLVELLAVNKSVHISDHQVIPYQAYVPPDELILAMQAINPERLILNRDSVSKFSPCLGGRPPPFEDVVGPYAAAIQIASGVSQFFSVSDEWEFSYIVPTSSAVPSTSKNQPDNSLHAVINAASRLNHTPTSSVSSPHPYQNLSSTQPKMSQPELDRLANNMFGSNSSVGGLTRTQMRFQGLWWGPERIWVDDFVRLKIPRRCLAPYGSQDISPPAGPSKKATEKYKPTGRDPSEIGAGSRGVFMRIDALFVVEIASEGKKRKECRISGPLYELVHEDWDENDDANAKLPKTNLQANAKSPRPIKPLPTRVASSSTTQPSSVVVPPISSAPAPSVTQSQVVPTNPVTPSLLPGQTATQPSMMPVHYLPPRSPPGFRFRPILSPGHEVVMSLSLLSGRYYPGLLMHPLLKAEVERASRVPENEGGILKYGHIWSLDGLGGGSHSNVDPEIFLPSRTRMLERSDREGYIALEDFKRQAIAKKNGEIDSADETDDVDMLIQEDETNEEKHDNRPSVSTIDKDGDVSMH